MGLSLPIIILSIFSFCYDIVIIVLLGISCCSTQAVVNATIMMILSLVLNIGMIVLLWFSCESSGIHKVMFCAISCLTLVSVVVEICMLVTIDGLMFVIMIMFSIRLPIVFVLICLFPNDDDVC